MISAELHEQFKNLLSALVSSFLKVEMKLYYLRSRLVSSSSRPWHHHTLEEEEEAETKETETGEEEARPNMG